MVHTHHRAGLATGACLQICVLKTCKQGLCVWWGEGRLLMHSVSPWRGLSTAGPSIHIEPERQDASGMGGVVQTEWDTSPVWSNIQQLKRGGGGLWQHLAGQSTGVVRNPALHCSCQIASTGISWQAIAGPPSQLCMCFSSPCITSASAGRGKSLSAWLSPLACPCVSS